MKDEEKGQYTEQAVSEKISKASSLQVKQPKIVASIQAKRMISKKPSELSKSNVNPDENASKQKTMAQLNIKRQVLNIA